MRPSVCTSARSIAGFLVVLIAGAVRGGELPSGLRVVGTTQPLLLKHCGACHGPDDANAGVRIDTLPDVIDSPEAARRWRQVLDVLNAGSMPPEDQPRLEPAAKLELLDDLSTVLAIARKALADTGGRIVMRRLNRREYANTLEHLLGIRVEPEGLPADSQATGFDTSGAELFMSAHQIEVYQAIAREALQAAWQRYEQPSASHTMRQEAETLTWPRAKKLLADRIDDRRRFVTWEKAVNAAAQLPHNDAAVAAARAARPHSAMPVLEAWSTLTGAPSPRDFGFADAIDAIRIGSADEWKHRVPYYTAYVTHPAAESGALLTINDPRLPVYFDSRVSPHSPAGEYILRARVALLEDAPQHRRFIEHGPVGNDGQIRRAGVCEVTGTLDKPQTLEIPFSVSANGSRVYRVLEKGTRDHDAQQHALFFDAFHKDGVGPPFAIWLDWVEVEGPVVADVPMTLADLLAVAAGNADSADARPALERFAFHAFRGRQPDPVFLDQLVALYDAGRSTGLSVREALQEPLVTILASPRFLYLAEPTSEGNRYLDGVELASRLSYFLGSSPPDERLLSLAARGELDNPDVLRAEADRLLDDPTTRDAFVRSFVHQWLGLDRLDFFQFDFKRFPRFDLATKHASREELFATVSHILDENLSLRHLLSSDFVVVDALMAEYYGLPGVHGDRFRPVSLPPDSPRGGLLGMAAVLAMGSNGEHTSPVERGAWVLRRLLHDPPPPAPPNVPQLSRLDDQPLTTRERVRMHQEEPQCASCHRKIDPLGFGLENFDAVGIWRTTDTTTTPSGKTATWAIDPSGNLHGGPVFADFFELREIIATRHTDFAAGFTEALLAYALGRPVEFTDDELTQSITAHAATADDAIREFVHAVVLSDAFRKK
jgi:hypothetical protein